jgi:hypothetical protein
MKKIIMIKVQNILGFFAFESCSYSPDDPIDTVVNRYRTTTNSLWPWILTISQNQGIPAHLLVMVDGKILSFLNRYQILTETELPNYKRSTSAGFPVRARKNNHRSGRISLHQLLDSGCFKYTQRI